MDKAVARNRGRKPSMAEGIARGFRIKILSGVYRPGDRLPTEAELAAEHGVNRATMREAIKKLEALGLVSVRQRTGIRVRDYWQDAGLELLQYLVETAIETDRLDLDLLRDLLEARRFFYAEIAALAAKRASDEALAEVLRRVDAVLASDGPEAFLSADLALVDALARGAGNLVILLVFNSFASLYREHFDLFATFYLAAAREREPFYRELRRLLVARDVRAVQRHVRRSFEKEDRRILDVAQRLISA